MRDLGTQLRAYYDRISRPTDPEDVVAGKLRRTMTQEIPTTTSWWRRPAVTVTAAALATLLLVGGGAFMMLRGDDSDVASDSATTSTAGPTTTLAPEVTTTIEATTTTVAPTTTEAVTALPASLGMTWERIDDAVFDDAWVSAVTEGGPGLVAVGYVLEEPYPADWYSDAAVWVSADGRTWDRVDEPAAFGNTPGNIEFLVEVEGTADGVAALGFIDGTGYARYTSMDGITWNLAEGAVDPETGLDPALVFDAIEGADVYDVVAAGPGYVAVGRIEAGDVGGAIWVSPDGTTWEQVAADLSTSIRQFERVATDGETILAFGWGSDATGFTTLTSSDGLTWTAADAPDGAPTPQSRAAFDAGRLVVVGLEWGTATGVYVSEDGGRSIYRLDPSIPALTGASPDMRDIVLFGDRFIVVGGDRGTDQQGQLWGGDPMIGWQGRGAVWVGTWNG
jgi:hypothetical protein